MEIFKALAESLAQNLFIAHHYGYAALVVVAIVVIIGVINDD